MVKFNLDKFTETYGLHKDIDKKTNNVFYDVTDYIFINHISESWANRKAQKDYAKHRKYDGKLKYIKKGRIYVVWFLIAKMALENDFELIDTINDQQKNIQPKTITKVKQQQKQIKREPYFIELDEHFEDNIFEKMLKFAKKIF